MKFWANGLTSLNILCTLLHFKSKGVNLVNLECHDQLSVLSSRDILISTISSTSENINELIENYRKIVLLWRCFLFSSCVSEGYHLGDLLRGMSSCMLTDTE